MSQENNPNRRGRRTRNIIIALAFITPSLINLIRSQPYLAKYAEDLKVAKDNINVREEAFVETIAAAAAKVTPSPSSTATTDDDENIDETFSLPREKLLEINLELRRRGNEMLNIHGKWENDRNNWIWIQNSTTTTTTTAGGITTTWASTLPLPDPEQQKKEITAPTNFPNATRLVMYGSSYTRELFLEMERLHYNISTRNVCDNLGWGVNTKCLYAKEWKDFTSTEEYIPIRQNGDCMPYYHQHSLGSRSKCSESPCKSFQVHPAPFGEGVDIDICGPPGFRVLRPNNNDIGESEIETGNEIDMENNNDDGSTIFKETHRSALKGKVAIGFKTFIHTPPSDNLFIERIRSVDLGIVDVAIVEMGYPWGPRGTRNTPNSSLPMNMTRMEEIKYYVDFVHDVAFPNTLVIWIATCGCTGNAKEDGIQFGIDETWDRVKEKELGIVLDKRYLCNQKPRAIHATHGCGGAVLGVLARMIFQLLHFINDEINFNQVDSV